MRESVKNKIKEYIKNETNDCIIYPILNKEGYGVIQTYEKGRKKHYLVHRVSYSIFYNLELISDEIICHKCDNPSCINPKHLFKGTHKDNSDDKVKKGRQAKGIKNGRYKTGYGSIYDPIEKPKSEFTKLFGRKLTEEQVKEIKELLKSKTYNFKSISEMLGIKESAIKDIFYKRTYTKI